MKKQDFFSVTPNFKAYFIYALIIKGLLFVAFSLLFYKSNPEKCERFFFTYCGDATGYIEPIVNLVDKGVYYEFNQEKNINLYAARMPGMLPILAPLYYFFGLKSGLGLLAILQYLIDALCCVLLGKIALRFFRNSKAFHFTFFIYVISSTVSVTSHYAVSEFLCTSFAIIAIYFILYATRLHDYFLSGIFATWSVFFRPTSILLFFFIPLLIAINEHSKISLKQLFISKTKLMLLILPFILVESVWVARNYRLLGRFIPGDINLENFGTPPTWSVFGMIMDLGGDLQSWNPESEMRWFSNKPGNSDYDSVYAASNPFPDYVMNAGIRQDELKFLREKYHQYSNIKQQTCESKKLELEIDSLCKTISIRFKSEAPFHYYILTRLRVLSTLIFIKRPYGFSFSQNGFWEKSIRAWHFISYYIPVILFLLGTLFIIRSATSELLIIVILAVSHLLLYGFIIRVSENRYVVPVYPWLVIAASGVIMNMTRYWKNLRQKRRTFN